MQKQLWLSESLDTIMNDTAIPSNRYQYDTTIPSSSVGSLLWSEVVAQMCSVKRVFLKISQKFTEKHLCWRLFFNKVACLSPAYVWCQLTEIFGKSFCKKSQTLNAFKFKLQNMGYIHCCQNRYVL